MTLPLLIKILAICLLLALREILAFTSYLK